MTTDKRYIKPFEEMLNRKFQPTAFDISKSAEAGRVYAANMTQYFYTSFVEGVYWGYEKERLENQKNR